MSYVESTECAWSPLAHPYLLLDDLANGLFDSPWEQSLHLFFLKLTFVC